MNYFPSRLHILFSFFTILKNTNLTVIIKIRKIVRKQPSTKIIFSKSSSLKEKIEIQRSYF